MIKYKCLGSILAVGSLINALISSMSREEHNSQLPGKTTGYKSLPPCKNCIKISGGVAGGWAMIELAPALLHFKVLKFCSNVYFIIPLLLFSFAMKNCNPFPAPYQAKNYGCLEVGNLKLRCSEKGGH